MPLMSITAPQKHVDRPLASWIGSLHPESHIAYFHAVQVRQVASVVPACVQSSVWFHGPEPESSFLNIYPGSGVGVGEIVVRRLNDGAVADSQRSIS
jgi:hypothetical protein